MLEQLLAKEREALSREREVSADLKEDRDRWRAQATGLLSDLCQRRCNIRPRGGVKSGHAAVTGAMARALTR